MENRIKKKFLQLQQQKRKALITYIMAYDPDFTTSLDILNNLPSHGADIIELGMPFSDPMADGPTIQEAAIRALKAGATTTKIFEMVKNFRGKNTDTPIILMGYYNPILNYGIEKFSSDAKNAGIDGLIIVDLPVEEDQDLYNSCQLHQLDLIKLLTPFSDEARIKQISSKASGFLYFVSIAGITGTKSPKIDIIENSYNKIKKFTNLPVVVGFGIKDAEFAHKISKFADGVVVGSALVSNCKNNSTNSVSKIYNLVNDIAKKLK